MWYSINWKFWESSYPDHLKPQVLTWMIVGILSTALSLFYQLSICIVLVNIAGVSEKLIMSSKRKKTKEKDDKRELYKQAAEAFRQGLFPSVTASAAHYQVNHKTLRELVNSEGEYVGGGRKLSAFTREEESRLVKFVSDRLSLGCGIDFSQLSNIMQELANALQASNPDREFPSCWVSNYPHESC